MITKVVVGIILISSTTAAMIAQKPVEKYEADWKSLAQWESPEWFEDAVFGIYWHWGPYSVAGFGYCCWYCNIMYNHEKGPDY